MKAEGAGAFYHLCGRVSGVIGEYPLDDKRCRRKIIDFIRLFAKVYCCQVLGFCIMSSHTHLVIRAGRDDLARLLKPVNAGFAVWLNRRLKRNGPVFSSHYKSILVDEEAYLLELIRYVHNNPVRAGLVKSAADTEWSSHRAYLGWREAPGWLNIGYVLAMFARQPKRARALFHEFVESGAGEGRRPDLCGERLKSAARRAQKGLGDGWRISGPILGAELFV